jgi:hypothetical protein
MIDAKQAVNTAYKFIHNLYESEELIDLALEEIELSSDEKYWLVTLGFTRLLSKPLEKKVVAPWVSIAEALQAEQQAVREYKIVKVDAETGDATSMKIRKV